MSDIIDVPNTDRDDKFIPKPSPLYIDTTTPTQSDNSINAVNGSVGTDNANNINDLNINIEQTHPCPHKPTKTVKHGNHMCTIVDNDLHYFDPETQTCVHHGTVENDVLIEDDNFVRKFHLNKFSAKIQTDNDRTKYLIMILLTGIFFVVELVVGIQVGSLALQSDAFHMLSDVLALSIGFIAKKLSTKGKTENFTFGYVRAEVIGSLINSVFLLASCFFITISAIERFFDYKDTDISGQLLELTIVAGIGLLINVIGILLFHSDSHDHSYSYSHSHPHDDKNHPHDNQDSHPHDSPKNHLHSHTDNSNKIQPNMNDHAVLLHIMGDLLGSVGVLATAGIVYFVDSSLALLSDPICSLFIVSILIYGSGNLARQSVNMLLNMVPIEIRAELIYDEILALDNVVNVHNFHIWSLSQDKAFSSLHFITDNKDTIPETVDYIKLILHKNKICNSSIQPEVADNANNNTGCRDINCGVTCLDTH